MIAGDGTGGNNMAAYLTGRHCKDDIILIQYHEIPHCHSGNRMAATGTFNPEEFQNPTISNLKWVKDKVLEMEPENIQTKKKITPGKI